MTTFGFCSDNSYYEKAGEHDRLLVVFNYWGQAANVRSHHRFVQDIPCNKLFLHSGGDDWFQNGVPGVAGSFEGLIEFCRSIPGRFQETKIFYLGHSMGAYAALGCGVAAGADHVFASAPEIDLGLAGSISAEYLRPGVLRHPSVRPILASNPKVPITCLVGRRCERDLRVANELRAFPQVDVRDIDCDHETFPYLRDKGALASLLHAFVMQDDMAAILRAL